MITKIATHKEPEFYLFETTAEEESYWEEICSLCNNRDCNDDCIFITPGAVECEDCNGKGRLKFIVNRGYPDAYAIVTKCGMCDGLGLI
jgi:DnaJ-class molecular chaperone